MISWLDAHTHLDSDELFSDKVEVLSRAEEAGVRKMMLVNSEATEKSFDRTQECLAMESPVARCAAFGIHPHHAGLYGPKLEHQLEERLKLPGVVALGEFGLDYYYNHSPRDAQIVALQLQARLALKLNLPVVIHCRDAYAELADVLGAEASHWKGMIHCFTGTAQEAERLLHMGFFISFSGIVTFRSADVLRDAAKLVPLNRILIETDAPYLAPVPHRGKTNEPAYVAHTARFLADLKNVTESDFSQQLFDNFFTLFGH
jgi:TatD DNase family protein